MRTQASAEFDWWFRASYSTIARTVFLVTGDRGRGEEITQDAFAKMWQHWSSVSRYERPDAWVRRVAIRMAVKQVKRERIRKERERLAVVRDDPPPLPDPDLADGVAQLSPMQRAVVVLFYWEDQSVFDIARALEVSESTVKQHLFRARARLAASWERRRPTMSVDDRIRAGMSATLWRSSPPWIEPRRCPWQRSPTPRCAAGRGGWSGRGLLDRGPGGRRAESVRPAWPVTPVPSPTSELFGRYESDVTQPRGLAGHWVLEFDGTGALLVTPPDRYPGVVSGTLFTADGTTLRTNLFSQDVCSDLGDGDFSWTREGARLALAENIEPCGARGRFFTDNPWIAVHGP